MEVIFKIIFYPDPFYRSHVYSMKKQYLVKTALFISVLTFELMQPRDSSYLLLDDGRKLCLECLDSAIMDTHECQPLYLEIQEFYEGLNMKVEQQVPMLLVERQALNEAMVGEKNVRTNGRCLCREKCTTLSFSSRTHLNFVCLWITGSSSLARN